jgi:hypothetical protein
MVAVKGREGTSSLFTGPCQPNNVVTCPALSTADDLLADRNVQNRTASLPQKKNGLFLIFFLKFYFRKTCSFYLNQTDHKHVEFSKSRRVATLRTKASDCRFSLVSRAYDGGGGARRDGSPLPQLARRVADLPGHDAPLERLDAPPYHPRTKQSQTRRPFWSPSTRPRPPVCSSAAKSRPCPPAAGATSPTDWDHAHDRIA